MTRKMRIKTKMRIRRIRMVMATIKKATTVSLKIRMAKAIRKKTKVTIIRMIKENPRMKRAIKKIKVIRVIRKKNSPSLNPVRVSYHRSRLRVCSRR